MIRTAALLACLGCLVSCSRELDLAHRYDNTESSKPFEGEEPSEDVGYIDMGQYLISERIDVPVPEKTPRAHYIPDGKISVTRFSFDSSWRIIWSGDTSYMQEGCSSPYLEDNISSLAGSMGFIGKGVSTSQDGFTDGGMWTIGMHELPDRTLAAFFHAESHYKGVASQYKSIGVAYSSDRGLSWDKGTKIISGPDPKPEVGEGGGKSYGLGDGCVVWNGKLGQWICYYSGYCANPGDFLISMAASSDANALPGTWKKWDGTGFNSQACDSESGLGAPDIRIEGLKNFRGGNPSVSWNTHIRKWMMTYHTWGKEIVMSVSDDGISWSEPFTIIGSELEKGGAMYPNLISTEGDLESGSEFRIYYSADMDNSTGKRSLAYRIVKFKNL
ncbi:MAG: hypothetical protein ACI3ZL_00250 [Candidatus Cryptobacteroides sp.]